MRLREMSYLEWDSAFTYPAGSVVSYAGTLWSAIRVSTNQPPARGSTYWAIVGLGSTAGGVNSVAVEGAGLTQTGDSANVTLENTGAVGLIAGNGITVANTGGDWVVDLTSPTYTGAAGITVGGGSVINSGVAGLNTPNPATVSISVDPSFNYTVGFTSNSPYTAQAPGLVINSNQISNTGVLFTVPGLGFAEVGLPTAPAFQYQYPRPSGAFVVNNTLFTTITNPGANAYIDLTQGQQIGNGSTIWSQSAAIQLVFQCDTYTSSGGPNVNIGLRAGGNLSAASGLPAFQYAQQTNVDLTGTSFSRPVITASFTLVNGIHYNVGGLVDTFLVFQGYINYQGGTFWNWYETFGSIQMLALF